MVMGRPRIDILIPANPFTTSDLKKQNPCVSAFVIQRNLQLWIAHGEVRRVGSRPNVGRTKAFYIYKTTVKAAAI
jgi:hypothetical protein